MNRVEFLNLLKKRLKDISKEDLKRTLDYYNEIISDKIDDGISEKEAIKSLGSIDEIVNEVKNGISSERKKSEKNSKGWKVALLISTFYIWVPILISIFAVIFSLYVSLWAIVVSLGAVGVSSIIVTPAGIIIGIIRICGGNTPAGIVIIGLSLVLAGIGILLCKATIELSKLSIKLLKKILQIIKHLFGKRGDLNE